MKLTVKDKDFLERLRRLMGPGISFETTEMTPRPPSAIKGRTVLLVDDILDEGHTLHAIRDYCSDRGAGQVLLAVLVRLLIHPVAKRAMAAQKQFVVLQEKIIKG